MNANQNNPVIIAEGDYNLLKPYFSRVDKSSDEMTLSAELSRAVIVKDDAFPPDVIRLNSKFSISDETTGDIKELTIVLPQYADITKKKISILTPIAAALIGFRKGDTTQWKVPAGIKVFKVIEVNAPEK